MNSWDLYYFYILHHSRSQLVRIQLRCVHSLLQRSCSTDVSITYLPQVIATHCSKVKINLTLLQYCNAVVRAETAFRALQLYCNAAAVDYERSFSLYIGKVGHSFIWGLWASILYNLSNLGSIYNIIGKFYSSACVICHFESRNCFEVIFATVYQIKFILNLIKLLMGVIRVAIRLLTNFTPSNTSTAKHRHTWHRWLDRNETVMLSSGHFRNSYALPGAPN